MSRIPFLKAPPTQCSTLLGGMLKYIRPFVRDRYNLVGLQQAARKFYSVTVAHGFPQIYTYSTPAIYSDSQGHYVG